MGRLQSCWGGDSIVVNNRFKGLTAALKGENLPEEASHQDEELQTTDIPHSKKKKGRQPGKRSNPEYEQIGVYIPKTLHVQVKKLLLDEENTDLSDLVAGLLQEWVGC
jgi:hypothetical protein